MVIVLVEVVLTTSMVIKGYLGVRRTNLFRLRNLLKV